MMMNIGILILRLGAAGMMMGSHGWAKVAKFETLAMTFPDPLGVGPKFSLGLAIFAEVLCALLVMIGAFTRVALIPLIITMAVAAFIIHGDDPFIKKEMALLYLTTFSALLLTGSGQYSVDHRMR